MWVSFLLGQVFLFLFFMFYGLVLPTTPYCKIAIDKVRATPCRPPLLLISKRVPTVSTQMRILREAICIILCVILEELKLWAYKFPQSIVPIPFFLHTCLQGHAHMPSRAYI